MFWLMSGDELEFGCPLLDSTWDQSQRGQQQPRCLVKSWFIWTLSCFGYLGSCFSLIYDDFLLDTISISTIGSGSARDI